MGPLRTLLLIVQVSFGYFFLPGLSAIADCALEPGNEDQFDPVEYSIKVDEALAVSEYKDDLEGEFSSYFPACLALVAPEGLSKQIVIFSSDSSICKKGSKQRVTIKQDCCDYGQPWCVLEASNGQIKLRAQGYRAYIPGSINDKLLNAFVFFKETQPISGVVTTILATSVVLFLIKIIRNRKGMKDFISEN